MDAEGFDLRLIDRRCREIIVVFLHKLFQAWRAVYQREQLQLRCAKTVELRF